MFKVYSFSFEICFRIFNVLFIFLVFQFVEKEGVINQMEFNMEQLRGDLQMKARQVGDLSNNISELKQELESLRNQNDSYEKEVELFREYFTQLQGWLNSFRDRFRPEKIQNSKFFKKNLVSEFLKKWQYSNSDYRNT